MKQGFFVFISLVLMVLFCVPVFGQVNSKSVETFSIDNFDTAGEMEWTWDVQASRLVADGYPVLGESGYIYVTDDKFTVNEDGMIYSQDTNEVIDRFKTVRFDNERYLPKTGAHLYRSTDISGSAVIAEGNDRPRFLQGYMETSNVNVVNEMVQMIEVNRAYEANQKTITSEDSMMGTLWTKTAVFNR